MNNQGSLVTFKWLHTSNKENKLHNTISKYSRNIKVKISLFSSSLTVLLAFHYCFVAHKEDTQGIMSEQAHSKPLHPDPRERPTQK